MYGLAHFIMWEPYDLYDLAHVFLGWIRNLCTQILHHIA